MAVAEAVADPPVGVAAGTGDETGLLVKGMTGEATGAGDCSGLAEGVTEEGAGLEEGMSMLGGLGTVTVPPDSGTTSCNPVLRIYCQRQSGSGRFHNETETANVNLVPYLPD